MFNRMLRLVRHRWMDDARHLVPPALQERLRSKVAASESLHTGEIRICIEAALPNSYLLRSAPLHTIIRQRAIAQFAKLGVWDTEHNNGVLIYLLLAERQIELVADRGMTRHVNTQAWQDMVQRLANALSDGKFQEGLMLAVDDVTAAMTAYFPLAVGQLRRNELPDQPVLA